MHGSKNIKGVFNYTVCVVAVSVVKQAVYSTELQKLYCSYVPGIIMVSPVTMYYKAVVCSTELQKLYCSYVPGMIMVTFL